MINVMLLLWSSVNSAFRSVACETTDCWVFLGCQSMTLSDQLVQSFHIWWQRTKAQKSAALRFVHLNTDNNNLWRESKVCSEVDHKSIYLE